MREKLFRPFGFYFATAAIAAACSLDPRLGWGQRFALLAAAWWIPAVHELGHATLAVLLRMPVLHSWAVPGFGRTRVLTRGRQLEFGLVALVGPLAGIGGALLVGAFARGVGPADGISPVCGTWLQGVALAGVLESAANLLPLSPLLDGTKVWKVLRSAYAARAWDRRIDAAVHGRSWDLPPEHVGKRIAPAVAFAVRTGASVQPSTSVSLPGVPSAPAALTSWGVVRRIERLTACRQLLRGRTARRVRASLTAAA